MSSSRPSTTLLACTASSSGPAPAETWYTTISSLHGLGRTVHCDVPRHTPMTGGPAGSPSAAGAAGAAALGAAGDAGGDEPPAWHPAAQASIPQIVMAA